jgi:hypothetical protein
MEWQLAKVAEGFFLLATPNPVTMKLFSSSQYQIHFMLYPEVPFLQEEIHYC